jgi:phosphate:Na+ symporter
VISELKRLNSLFCATAYPVLEQAGMMNRSRMKEGAAEKLDVAEAG